MSFESLRPNARVYAHPCALELAMLLDKEEASSVLKPSGDGRNARCASNEQVQQRDMGPSMRFGSLKQGSSCHYIHVVTYLRGVPLSPNRLLCHQ